MEDVIEHRETRKKIIAALEFFKDKKAPRLSKKHGNIPL